MMSERLALLGSALITAGLIATPRTATAQGHVVSEVVNDNSFDANAVTSLDGHGYELSKGLFLHSSIGLGGGASDNVFFESSDESPVGAGMLRLNGTLFLASDKARPDYLGDPDLEVNDATPRNYEFRGGVRLGYEEFLTGTDLVRSQRNLNVNALADLVVLPAGPVAFILRDRFTRDSRSPNFETSNTLNRDDNRLELGVRFQPIENTLSATVHYQNWLSVFENGSTSQFANRMNHTAGVLGEWQWRPFTKLLADVSYGMFGPMGESTVAGMPYKTASNPFRMVVGVSTLLETNTTLKVHAGYARASYEVGEGYSAPVLGAEFAYRWSPTGRIVALYDYDHFDSFNANFYRDHLMALRLVQQIGFAVLDGGPEVRLRRFGGIPPILGASDRDDLAIGANLRLQVLFAERFTVSAEYRLQTVQTEYRANTLDAMGNVVGVAVDNPSYVRNEFMLGVRAAY